MEEDARHPLGAFLYTVSCLHCMTVSLAARRRRARRDVGRARRRGACSPRRASRELEVQTLPHDLMNFYYVARKHERRTSDAGDAGLRSASAAWCRRRVRSPAAMIYRFGDYELDEEAGELRRRGEAASRSSRSRSSCSRFLLRERERVVPRDELFERALAGRRA